METGQIDIGYPLVIFNYIKNNVTDVYEIK